MKPEKDPRIEELLNGYLDGELSQEDTAEVQRLIGGDEKIARRLKELEKCKILVSSLPPAEPPAYLISGIKELLQNRLVTGDTGHIEKRRGARHLFIRHVLAASLMIGLLGIMGVVVYRIVSPEGQVSPTVAVQPKITTAPQVLPSEATKVASNNSKADIGFYSLQVQTSDYVAVDAFVNKLLDESTWLKYEVSKEGSGRSIYRVLCSKGGLEALVSDLTAVWPKFDSATLVVRTVGAGENVTVAAVRPEQITEIANQDTPEGRIRLAKDFAAFNNVEQIMPGGRMLAFAERAYNDLTTIPKPVLTSGEKTTAKVPAGALDQVRVDLNIVVSARK